MRKNDDTRALRRSNTIAIGTDRPNSIKLQIANKFEIQGNAKLIVQAQNMNTLMGMPRD